MMNNHTATAVVFALTLAATLLSYTVTIPTKFNSFGQRSYTTSQGKGFIKISNSADVDTAISEITTQDTQQSTPVEGSSPAANTTPIAYKVLANKTIATNMKKVHHIAKEFGHHETMQAILLQESNGGTSAPVGNVNSPMGKRSYGLMQVQLVAARSILSRYPNVAERYFPNRKISSVTDEEVIALLLRNDEANIRIAVYHFDLYLTLSNGNWYKAVAAYNMGIGNANKRTTFDDIPYVKSIKTRIHTTVKPFNAQNRQLIL
jgi:hypothetical protein